MIPELGEHWGTRPGPGLWQKIRWKWEREQMHWLVDKAWGFWSCFTVRASGLSLPVPRLCPLQPLDFSIYKVLEGRHNIY